MSFERRSVMRHTILAAAAAMFLICATTAVSAPWGANYFPNVPLITQDGKSVRFFDDVIKDKVVVINFIYTRCPDTCPLETAQLVKVQEILGDRVGKDIFFYSISIDPKNDTPSVLKNYQEMFRARWTFLTGKESDIVKIRKKLGLYIPEIQDRSYNHNVNMIIGNQATGRWMKRSPFENPYVLADQIGNWLQGWKSPPKGDDYANAPKLRSIPPGEQLYRTRCTSCHSLIGYEEENALGPDLLGVTQRREMDWLLNWLRVPDQMLKEKDPIAMRLYYAYNNLNMPNLRLNKQEVADLIAYMDEESQRVLVKDKRAREKLEHEGSGASVTAVLTVNHAKPASDVVAIMNAWVREAHLGAKVNAGYMTLVNVGSEEVTLVKVESEAFEKIEIHEMAMVDGLMTMRELTNLVIPANGQAQLKPGGKHLMLMGPRQNLTTGQQVDMTLTFKSGIKQTVSVGVFATGGNAKDLPSKKSPAVEVIFETTKGGFALKLNPEKAPKTVTNFLAYVDEGFYNNTLFHRVIPKFVVQGGGLEKGMEKKQTHPPVENESHNGLENSRGTISMARTRDPHSAASQFFINVVHNPSLDFRNNQPGYTVFGKVTDGMDVIDKMVAVLTTSLGGYKDVPKEDIVILSAKRKE
jgi:cyclophilin family peptidyl-prolyl cis-trans isomerase/copper(I)-binding protein/cytochrome oxidase Cu insertion factor (SCO1/SenC/PrrC family)